MSNAGSFESGDWHNRHYAWLNVLVPAKEIIRIVIFDGNKPLIIVSVGCFHAPFHSSVKTSGLSNFIEITTDAALTCVHTETGDA